MTPLSSWSRGIASSTTAGVEDVTLHTLIRPTRLTAEQVRLARYSLPKGSKTTNGLQATGGIDDGPASQEAGAFPPETSFVEEAAPYLCAPRSLDGLCILLKEATRRRLTARTLEAVAEQIAQ